IPNVDIYPGEELSYGCLEHTEPERLKADIRLIKILDRGLNEHDLHGFEVDTVACVVGRRNLPLRSKGLRNGGVVQIRSL
ncbi:MAG: hypothetical protein KKE57_02795, partial [Proteobacteria bacterium]|nr:hypothetical protein [Pseudomonadota bacterium]